MAEQKTLHTEEKNCGRQYVREQTMEPEHLLAQYIGRGELGERNKVGRLGEPVYH